jgi:hypothetical protein
MTALAVIVFAFDPVDELEGRVGVIAAEPDLARRLIAEHRAELVEPYCNDTMRFVAGSAAHQAAGDALRAARDRIGVRKVRPAARAQR